MFFEKAVLRSFRKFLENHLWQSTYWKPIIMLNMSSVPVPYVLCRNFLEIFRIAILNENIFMGIPHSIKKHFWMGASDKATPLNRAFAKSVVSNPRYNYYIYIYIYIYIIIWLEKSEKLGWIGRNWLLLAQCLAKTSWF